MSAGRYGYAVQWGTGMKTYAWSDGDRDTAEGRDAAMRETLASLKAKDHPVKVAYTWEWDAASRTRQNRVQIL